MDKAYLRPAKGQIVQAAAGARQELVGRSPTRQALMVHADNASTCYIGSDDMMLAGTQLGFVVTSGGPPLYLTYERVGELVRQAWYARSTAGTSNVVVVEIMEP